jgi:hypothetical protein
MVELVAGHVRGNYLLALGITIFEICFHDIAAAAQKCSSRFVMFLEKLPYRVHRNTGRATHQDSISGKPERYDARGQIQQMRGKVTRQKKSWVDSGSGNLPSE